MKKLFQVSALAAALLFAAGGAQAGATIINPAGTIAMGVNDLGNLDTVSSVADNGGGFTGLAFKYSIPDRNSGTPTFYDAIAPACLCEGWGVSTSGVSGHASVGNGGTVGIALDSFASTATTATSIVHLASLSQLSVTHAFSPADNAPDALFKSVVTITNTGGDLTNLRYVRVMDWDIPPNETLGDIVTIRGAGNTAFLESAHDGGFATPDPLLDPPGILIPDGSPPADFTVGISDLGAYFRFNFGNLLAGQSRSFTMFYGAAASESAAIAAIAKEGIELYSLGQGAIDTNNDTFPDALNPSGPTFIFGFKGVGGTPIYPVPGGVPEPASLALLGLGLAGLGMARRRKS